MKKTMFITSVIMVVVLAVALTTSSLAWFSAGGSDNVTTSAFKVTATAGASTGIAISHDRSNWESNITLAATGSTGLNPLVPFAKKGTGIDAADLLAALVGGTEVPYLTAEQLAADVEGENPPRVYDSIYTAAEALDTPIEYPGDFASVEEYYEALVAAGLISDQNIGTTAAAGAARSAYMIGNKYDNNNKFTNDLYRTGYYTDTFYITNLASGSGAATVYLDTNIYFKFEKEVNYGTELEPVWRTEDDDYTRAKRGSALYDTDAVLCVAVLAKVSEFDTDMIEYFNEHNTAGDGWEIIAYADSKGGSTVKLGKQATDFDLGSPIANCIQTIATTGLNKTNTEGLRPERTYTLTNEDLAAANTALGLTGTEDELVFTGTDADGTGVTLSADIKEIKVIAWYDSTLVNNNAANANLKFDLKFSIHTGS